MINEIANLLHQHMQESGFTNALGDLFVSFANMLEREMPNFNKVHFYEVCFKGGEIDSEDN